MKTPIALAVGAMLAAGCAGKQPAVVQQATPQQSVQKIPEWYLSPPTDQNYLYSTATGSSRDLQIAADEAELNARNALAAQMASKLESYGKRMAQEVGEAGDSQILRSLDFATKSVVSNELTGSRTAKREVLPNGNTYTVYVLMELPVGKANEALMSKLKADQQMYTRFRATKAFEDLDAEVKKYEEWKKKPPL